MARRRHAEGEGGGSLRLLPAELILLEAAEAERLLDTLARALLPYLGDEHESSESTGCEAPNELHV